MEAKASVKMARISSQKANLVCELIRNKSIENSFAILDNSNKKAARIIKKVLNSSIANATENHGMTSENLYVKAAYANEGPSMKRYRPRAKGRGDTKLKRTSHITVVVTDEKRGK
jgi:large subunit ribosomal protein L22